MSGVAVSGASWRGVYLDGEAGGWLGFKAQLVLSAEDILRPETGKRVSCGVGRGRKGALPRGAHRHPWGGGGRGVFEV